MSHFSDIGFTMHSQEDFEALVDSAYSKSTATKVNEGTYFVYSDKSGAEMWIQFNNDNECIGANPHYNGKSRRTVCLTNTMERPESELDGAFHGWAAPAEKNNPESGDYPFVFDSPGFKTTGNIPFPVDYDIQLAAFAQELSVFDNEQEYDNSQASETKYAVQSFIPTGLFAAAENPEDDDPPQALAMFTGIIKQYERKRNGLTGHEFYWLLVDTLGGDVDVVADVLFFEKEPVKGGVLHGRFWLSGQLLHPAGEQKTTKNFFQKLFGK